jgi:hypothetical protein
MIENLKLWKYKYETISSSIEFMINCILNLRKIDTMNIGLPIYVCVLQVNWSILCSKRFYIKSLIYYDYNMRVDKYLLSLHWLESNK